MVPAVNSWYYIYIAWFHSHCLSPLYIAIIPYLPNEWRWTQTIHSHKSLCFSNTHPDCSHRSQGDNNATGNITIFHVLFVHKVNVWKQNAIFVFLCFLLPESNNMYYSYEVFYSLWLTGFAGNALYFHDYHNNELYDCLYSHGFTLISTLISNYIHHSVR